MEETIRKTKRFKNKNEFIRFAILKLIIELNKEEFNKEEFREAMDKISEKFKDLSEEEILKLAEEAKEWARREKFI